MRERHVDGGALSLSTAAAETVEILRRDPADERVTPADDHRPPDDAEGAPRRTFQNSER